LLNVLVTKKFSHIWGTHPSTIDFNYRLQLMRHLSLCTLDLYFNITSTLYHRSIY